MVVQALASDGLVPTGRRGVERVRRFGSAVKYHVLYDRPLALLDDAARLPVVRLALGGMLLKMVRQALKLRCTAARYRREPSRMMRRNMILSIQPITRCLACDTAEMR